LVSYSKTKKIEIHKIIMTTGKETQKEGEFPAW
jgi:hypothetical protein